MSEMSVHVFEMPEYCIDDILELRSVKSSIVQHGYNRSLILFALHSKAPESVNHATGYRGLFRFFG